MDAARAERVALGAKTHRPLVTKVFICGVWHSWWSSACAAFAAAVMAAASGTFASLHSTRWGSSAHGPRGITQSCGDVSVVMSMRTLSKVVLVGPDFGQSDRIWPEFFQISLELDGIWLDVDQIWPGLHLIWATSTDLCTNSTKLGSNSPSECEPMYPEWSQVMAKLTEFGPITTDSGQTRANFGHFRLNLAECAQDWPKSGQTRPMSPKFGRIRANFGRPSRRHHPTNVRLPVAPWVCDPICRYSNDPSCWTALAASSGGPDVLRRGRI